MGDPTVIAVDWSGARGPGPHGGIWLTAVRDSEIVEHRGLWGREEVVAHVAATTGRFVVGFDFSFGYPSWVGAIHGLATGPDVWSLVEAEGEAWLKTCPSPFWGNKGTRRPTDVELFRESEKRLGAKSTFFINGGGAVGKGAIRGMPLLKKFREDSISVWPFDQPTDRLVVEVYPRACLDQPCIVSNASARLEYAHWLAARWPALRARPDIVESMRISSDALDSAVAAYAMWNARDQFADLRAADDAEVVLEGQIWTPRDKPA